MVWALLCTFFPSLLVALLVSLTQSFPEEQNKSQRQCALKWHRAFSHYCICRPLDGTFVSPHLPFIWCSVLPLFQNSALRLPYLLRLCICHTKYISLSILATMSIRYTTTICQHKSRRNSLMYLSMLCYHDHEQIDSWCGWSMLVFAHVLCVSRGTFNGRANASWAPDCCKLTYDSYFELWDNNSPKLSSG